MPELHQTGEIIQLHYHITSVLDQNQISYSFLIFRQ